jgi:hypothetical protein
MAARPNPRRLLHRKNSSGHVSTADSPMSDQNSTTFSVGWPFTGPILVAAAFSALAFVFRQTSFFGPFWFAPLLAAAHWIFKQPSWTYRRYSVDDEGIRSLGFTGSSPSMRWADVQSYKMVERPNGNEDLMLVSQTGSLALPCHVKGWTFLNDAVLSHLPPTTQVDEATAKEVQRTPVPGFVGVETFRLTAWWIGTAFIVTSLFFLSIAYFLVPPSNVDRNTVIGVAGFGFIGLLALIYGALYRCEANQQGLSFFNVFGPPQRVAWEEVRAFEFEWRLEQYSSSRYGGSYRRLRPVRYFILRTDHNFIRLDSRYSDWSRLRQIILTHLPSDARVDLSAF